MVKKMSKFLVLTAVIAAVALFAVVEAGAVICPDPILKDGECLPSEEGRCCATLTDVYDNDWVVEVVPDDNTNIFPDTTPVVYGTTEALCTDNRGNDLGATGFTYKITPPIGGVITHAAVTFPAPDEDCGITKICPKDNSTKFGPEFNGWSPAPHLWVGGTSSIKSIPDNKNLFSLGTTSAGADSGTIHLWTSNGELDGEILTPTCCEPAHVKSNIKVAGIELTFDTCSGDLITSLLEDSGFIPVTGFFCDTESDGTIIEGSCSEAKKTSGEEALFMNLCIQYSNNFGDNSPTIDRNGRMTTLIGYGPDLFLGPPQFFEDTYTGDGIETTFDVTFDYKVQSDVLVYLAGILQAGGYQWVENEDKIQFIDGEGVPNPPGEGVEVKFFDPKVCVGDDTYKYQTATGFKQSSTACQSEIVFDGKIRVTFDCDNDGEPVAICDLSEPPICIPYKQLGTQIHIGACFNDSIKNKGNVTFDECSLVVDTGGATWSNRWGGCWGPLCAY